MLKKLAIQLAGGMGYEVRRRSSSESRRCWPPWSPQAQTTYEVDEWFQALFDHATRKTQMESTDNALRRQRHYTLNHLAQHALSNLDGDICEAGCWRGLSTYQIAQRIRDAGKNVTFHVFDSFEGLSDYQNEDKTSGVDLPYEHIRKALACPLDTVKENLADFDFIKFYQGWIPERFPEVSTTRFSFVHIDVDMYQPIRDSFAFFYPRLVGHGIMVFDDYGAPSFPGAKQAIDEKLVEFDHPFFVPLPSGQAFLIKTPEQAT